MDRYNWKKLIRRVNPDKSEWEPGHQARVCSIHFIDGKKTDENPNPILNLGYSDYLIPKEYVKTGRRTLSYKSNQTSAEEVPLLANDKRVSMGSDEDGTKSKENDSTDDIPCSSNDTTFYHDQFMEIDESSDFENDVTMMGIESESDRTGLNSSEILGSPSDWIFLIF